MGVRLFFLSALHQISRLPSLFFCCFGKMQRLSTYTYAILSTVFFLIIIIDDRIENDCIYTHLETLLVLTTIINVTLDRVKYQSNSKRKQKSLCFFFYSNPTAVDSIRIVILLLQLDMDDIRIEIYFA